MITSKELGKIFQDKRKEKTLTVDEVCQMSRIHPNVISDIESGVFDRLGKPYVRGFLKKYSAVLELDTENMLEKYESISSASPGLQFTLDLDEEEKENENIFAAGNVVENKIQIALVIALSVVLVVLFFVFVGMVRSKMSGKTETRVTAPRRTREVAAPVVPERPTRQVREEKPVARTSGSSTPSTAPVVLKLKAQGEAWVQVKSGDDMLFAGILEKGESKTWRSNGTITVWTGKGEMLDFYVNTRKVGKVAAGVVKNIKVSSNGIKIGDSWVSRLD